ncbi:putative magnesium chelatase subunit [Gordonia araii NBRC 100433]|uniref:Putative magnesium chelatase subunit n=1 Tax=Gordonia araii NBRC 100433 TaxID=1073574 RepID=G7GYH2_9ACTN|nr:VWA domain-containing protein [Gordonia araii]NNG97356.1 VWA domain-containing protein [Gordonia araii NBRC 100433]GAB08647.1 putative magnesium chelatase subunit [Gordonia araii NBRC 100433]
MSLRQAPLPWDRPPESLLSAREARLCRAWRRGARFGLLLVGDAWSRERLLEHLRPADSSRMTPATTAADLPGRGGSSAVVIAAADLIDDEVAALVDDSRILASAPDIESVPAALAARLTVVIGLGARPALRCRRPPLAVDPVDDAVGLLAHNGIDSHLLDIGAARCLRALGTSPLEARAIVSRYIVEPRLRPLAPAAAIPPEPEPGTTDGAESAAGPSGGDGIGELDPDVAESGAAPVGMVAAGTPEMPPWATLSVARRYAARRYPGRRGVFAVSRRGRLRRVVGYGPALGLDVPQTLRAAALAGRVDADALRSAIRVRRSGRFTVVILDRSDSMSGVRAREAAGMVAAALDEAKCARSRIAVIVARGARAELAVEPTTDLLAVHATLGHTTAGGGTPLASAFLLTAGLVGDLPRHAVRVLVLSDGGANVALPEVAEPVGVRTSPVEQAGAALRLLVGLTDQVLVVPSSAAGIRIRDGDLDWMRDAGAVVRPAGPR